MQIYRTYEQRDHFAPSSSPHGTVDKASCALAGPARTLPTGSAAYNSSLASRDYNNELSASLQLAACTNHGQKYESIDAEFHESSPRKYEAGASLLGKRKHKELKMLLRMTPSKKGVDSCGALADESTAEPSFETCSYKGNLAAAFSEATPAVRVHETSQSYCQQ